MLAGCSSASTVDEVIPAAPSPPPADITTINGEVPPGEPVWWIVEPGESDLEQNFGGDDSADAGHM